MNEEQIVYWDGAGGQRWTKHQEVLDRAIRVYGNAALDAAAVRGGERALDVGCGCGETSLALAERAGASGAVLGLDLSAQMLERARQRAAGRSNLEFRQADAAAIALPAEFDLVFSRFGVMFFEDPTLAFTNLRRALRSSGRLSFVAWRDFEQNPWARVPIEAVHPLVPDAVAAFSSDVPGPWAFADRDKVARILSGAGFREVAIERFNAAVSLGAELDEAVEFAFLAGPVSRLLAGTSPEVQQQARERLRSALAPHRTAAGFVLPGSSWIVTARA